MSTTTPLAEALLGNSEVYFTTSSFTTALGPEDWRIGYMTVGGDDGWLLRLRGPGAGIKAQAIVMILNGDTP